DFCSVAAVKRPIGIDFSGLGRSEPKAVLADNEDVAVDLGRDKVGDELAAVSKHFLQHGPAKFLVLANGKLLPESGRGFVDVRNDVVMFVQSPRRIADDTVAREVLEVCRVDDPDERGVGNVHAVRGQPSAKVAASRVIGLDGDDVKSRLGGRFGRRLCEYHGGGNEGDAQGCIWKVAHQTLRHINQANAA